MDVALLCIVLLWSARGTTILPRTISTAFRWVRYLTSYKQYETESHTRRKLWLRQYLVHLCQHTDSRRSTPHPYFCRESNYLGIRLSRCDIKCVLPSLLVSVAYSCLLGKAAECFIPRGCSYLENRNESVYRLRF